jgi:hypothetical protein
MHPVTGLLLLGALPAAVVAVMLNVALVAVRRPSAACMLGRLAALVLFWVALFVLLSCDPGRVAYWWLD